MPSEPGARVVPAVHGRQAVVPDPPRRIDDPSSVEKLVVRL